MNKQIKLQRLKERNTIWHKESGLVFKSEKEKVVVGRWVDGNFIDLDIDAIELCEKWNFKYDETLVDLEDDEDEEDVVHEPEIEGKEPEGEPEAEDVSESEGEDVPENEPEPEPESSSPVPSEQPERQGLSLGDITENFVRHLDGYVTSLVEMYENKVTVLEAQLLSKTKEFEDMKADYGKLKTKFDGIKSLFS